GASQWTYTLIYDRLVEELGDGLYGPMLATSWSTEDYQTFVFNLREDVYFHNGEPFTAEDVAGTIRVALENLGSIGFERWRTVESWNVIDDHTIEITLASVHLDFLFDISAPAGGIIHEASFRANAEEGAWIGTGPFKVTAFSTNDFVTVERFDDYWGEAPPTRSMSLRFVPEMATRLVMLQNRESHLCFGISSEDLPILQADPDFQIIPLTMNAPNGLGFNMADPLMADPNFRRAVLHSLNLEEIAMVAAGDGARAPEDGNMWGLITPYRLNNIPRWEQNLDLAREYLAASPYAGEPVEISAGVATNIRAAEIVQHQLGQVGIDVVINAMDMASWVAYVAYGNNQSQMWINGVTFTLSPIASVTNIYLPGMGVNRTSFNNPHVTAIIEQLQGETDADTRRALFTELQEFISADPPMVNLFWRIFGIAAVNELGGLQLSPDSFRHNLRGIYMAA
ncbi:MAG: ABC transporter substrate-binding protein, partial [Oscillospiraceae bacterium]|nr:ABC transporter substrate-binding protein [Oscillospiraceae bacterium]